MNITTLAIVDAALSYARQGYRVFPVNRDKTPCVPWQTRATDDETLAQLLWATYPDANVAIALPPDIIVFDVDPRHRGTLESLGTLPETAIARTGSGGWHVYFTLPEGFTPPQNSPLPGIDTRIGGKGYVVVAPSIHSSGNVYAWIDGCSLLDRQPAPLPEHLKQLLQKPKKPTAQPTTGQGLPGHYWLEKAIARVQNGDDTRNNGGLWLVLQLRDNGLPEEEAEAVMLAYHEAIEGTGDHTYKEEEALASLRSAYTREARDPAGNIPSEEGWICAAEVQPKAIDWLWQGRIPLGMITGLIGDGSVGKSLLTTYLAACVSTGTPLVNDHVYLPVG